jgi:hypothetical protein
LQHIYTFRGMPVAVQMGMLLAFAALLIAQLWRTQRMPVAVSVGQTEPEGPKRPEDGSDDEQLPETDRAPRGVPRLLTYAVAATAALRVGILVALHR